MVWGSCRWSRSNEFKSTLPKAGTTPSVRFDMRGFFAVAGVTGPLVVVGRCAIAWSKTWYWVHMGSGFRVM